MGGDKEWLRSSGLIIRKSKTCGGANRRASRIQLAAHPRMDESLASAAALQGEMPSDRERGTGSGIDPPRSESTCWVQPICNAN